MNKTGIGNLRDVSEYIENDMGAAASDSEAEDEAAKIELPDKFIGRGEKTDDSVLHRFLFLFIFNEK